MRQLVNSGSFTALMIWYRTKMAKLRLIVPLLTIVKLPRMHGTMQYMRKPFASIWVKRHYLLEFRDRGEHEVVEVHELVYVVLERRLEHEVVF